MRFLHHILIPNVLKNIQCNVAGRSESSVEIKWQTYKSSNLDWRTGIILKTKLTSETSGFYNKAFPTSWMNHTLALCRSCSCKKISCINCIKLMLALLRICRHPNNWNQFQWQAFEEYRHWNILISKPAKIQLTLLLFFHILQKKKSIRLKSKMLCRISANNLGENYSFWRCRM